MSKKEPKVKRISRLLQDSAGVIAAVVAIGGTLVGGGKWLSSEITASTNARVDSLETTIADNQKNNELATMRLELMVLISHDPNNTIEIAKLARKYFNPPYNGDSYMTSIISKWCNEQNVNCGEIMLK